MTLEELQKRLDTNRAWRKIELSQARSVAERHRTSAELSYLCRAWTLLIYAHCDKCLKHICRDYLLYLAANPRKDYDYKIVWLSFFGKDAIRNGGETRFLMCRSESEETRAKVLENICGKEIFESWSFSHRQLRFFSELVLQSTFDHENYKAFCVTLKEKRDGIAHGEEILISSVDDCLVWHEPAISLLDALVESTIDQALKH